MNQTKKNPTSSSLTCIQTLKPPPPPSTNTTTSFISKTDELLSIYASQSTTHNASPVWKCSWSHDGSTLATCHGRPDPCVLLWKFEPSPSSDECEWTVVVTLRDGEDGSEDGTMLRTIRSMTFAPTPPNVRQILAVASFDGSIFIWEVFTSQTTLNGNSNDLDMDTNWNTPCGWECTAQLEGHENEVKDVTWNATGTLLASCRRDKSVWIWECFLPGTIGAPGDGSSEAVQAMKGILNVWQYSNLTPGISKSGRDVRCSLVHSGYKSANGW